MPGDRNVQPRHHLDRDWRLVPFRKGGRAKQRVGRQCQWRHAHLLEHHICQPRFDQQVDIPNRSRIDAVQDHRRTADDRPAFGK
ncbi:hypothetical protein P0F65_21245 [Sphingomonas sp. I4]